MRKYKLMENLMDCLVFCLTSGCLSGAFLKSIHLEVNMGRLLLAHIALYIVLYIIFRNKWTALTTLALAAAIGFYLAYRLPEPLKWVHSSYSFLKWQLDYITGKTALKLEYIVPVTWFWISLFGVVFYLLMIRIRWFLLPFAAGTALLIVLWLLGHHGIFWYIWLYALGCLLVWGGNYHKKLSRQFSLPHYGLWQIYVLPLSIAVLLTARLMIPLNVSYTWPFLVETVEKIDEMIDDRFGFSAPRQPFRLSVTGFPSSHDQLGGPVQISRDLVLEVTSPIPLYLRGSLLNEYISTGWLDTIEDMRYRFRDSAWTQIKRTAYNFDERIWQDLDQEKLEQIFPEIEAVVTHVGIEGSAMFHALQLSDIRTVKGASTPYFNTRGETFANRNIEDNEPYTLISRVPNMTNEDFIRYLNEEVPSLDWRMPLPDGLTDSEAYLAKMLDIQQNYMAIPDTVPQRVLDLAEEITEGKETSYEKILAIQEYLRTHFSYTLTPPFTPANRDFVDYFLFDLEEGYCTYFASAMAVMGRAAGIPTRYVEGFLMPSRPDSRGVYDVMKLNGHAWVEVYFPYVGWLPFDPTPPDALSETVGDRAFNTGDQSLYWQFYWEQMMEEQSQDVYEPSPIDISPGKPVKTTEQVLKEALLGLLVAVVSLFLLTVIGLIVYYKRHWSWVDEEPLQHRLHIYYTEILWYLELYETPIKRGETPYTYAKRVDEWLVCPVGSMMDIASILVRSEFGHHKLTEEDLDRVKALYKFLKENIRDVMGYRQYLMLLIRRMLTYRRHRAKKSEGVRKNRGAEII